jgi:hypothetical protein
MCIQITENCALRNAFKIHKIGKRCKQGFNYPHSKESLKCALIEYKIKNEIKLVTEVKVIYWYWNIEIWLHLGKDKIRILHQRL